MTEEKMNASQTNDTNTMVAEKPPSRFSRNKKSKPVDESSSMNQEQATKKRLWVQIRLLPIWLRIILVLLLLVGAAVLGVMFGYGVLGDGVPQDVLKKETWLHIVDIMSGKEKK